MKHYAAWRISYTLFWKIDALCWTYGERHPRLEQWLWDRMDRLGIRMGFLLP